jgi:xylose isomerase
MTLGMLEILRGGGLTTGGLMFDTKLRRQSIARDDLFHGHIGAMDTMARSLLAAASIIEEGELERRRTERYAGWNAEQRIMDAERDDAVSLQQLHDAVLADETFDPQPASGRQEALEHLVARHIERTH